MWSARWIISSTVFLTGLSVLVWNLPPSKEKRSRSAVLHTVTVEGAWWVRPVAPPPDPTGPAAEDAPPRPAIEPPPAPPSPVGEERKPGTREYRVGQNDSLWKISARILGSGHRWPEIAKLNPKIRPDDLREGTILKLPPHSDLVRYHVVREGENLSEIALAYYGRGDWQPIFRANRDRVKNPSLVRSGIRLRIPPYREGSLR